MTANITPSSTSSTILIMVSMTIHPGDASNNAVKVTFFKDSSEFLTAKASGQGNRTVVF